MWFLTEKNNEETRSLTLLCNRTYKIGRFIENNDIGLLIEGDPTVSRLHAEILIKFDENKCTNPQEIPSIVLTDHSKCGTFVNEVKVEGFKTIKPNDCIRFGINQSSFILKKSAQIITTSGISNENKANIKKLITKLGSYLVDDWQNDCSFMLSESITMTVKVLNALICQKLIVTQKYLEISIQNALSNQPPPNIIDYLTSNFDPSLNSKEINIKPCKNRQFLFKDKVFIFFSDSQLQQMQNTIELASGQSKLFSKYSHLNVKTLEKNRDSFIFIKCSDECKTPEKLAYINKLVSLLDGLNQRLVDESEIGLAILYLSIAKNCNTSKSFKHDSSENQIKLGYQTQSLYDSYPIEIDSQFKHKNQDSSMIPDSLALQFENKIDDLLIVPETPPDKTPLSERNNSPRLNNQSFTDTLLSPQDEKILLKEKKLACNKIYDDFDMLNDSIESSLEENVKPINKKLDYNSKINENNKSTQKKDKTQNLKNNASQSTRVKTENVIKMETSIHNYTKLDLDVVYSKKAPPAHSIKLKNEENYETECFALQDKQMNIKFENLVVKKENNPNLSMFTNGQKVNFKKFVKIPKATQSQSSKSKHTQYFNKSKTNKSINQSKNVSLFKSFKNEPFDVDSQFQMFLNSQR